MACDVVGSMYVASSQQNAGLKFGEEHFTLQINVQVFLRMLRLANTVMK